MQSQEDYYDQNIHVVTVFRELIISIPFRTVLAPPYQQRCWQNSISWVI